MSAHDTRIDALTEEQRAWFMKAVNPEYLEILRNRPEGGTIDRYAVDTLYDQYLTQIETSDAETVFNYDVAEELQKLRVRAKAKQLHATEIGGATPAPPAGVSLKDLLAQPDDDAEYTIDRLFPAGTCQMLAAQAKAGKTRLIGNLIRALVDGEPFLGKYQVQQVGAVTLIDNEMDERMIRRWLRAQGIRNIHKVEVVSLRGQVGAFNIIDPAERAKLVRLYEGSDVYIFDCLRPSLDALGLDENREAGQFVQAWKAFVYECGGEESVIAHHMGHNGERARGDSGLIGGVDGTWKIVLESPDESGSDRFFSAYGRDVDESEQRLVLDGAHLTAVAGTRKESKNQDRREDLTTAVLDLVKEHGGWNGTDVSRALKQQGITHRNGEPSQILKQLVVDGMVRVEDGRNNAKHYYFIDQAIPVIPAIPSYPGDTPIQAIPLSPTLREGIAGTAETAEQTQGWDNQPRDSSNTSQPGPGLYNGGTP